MIDCLFSFLGDCKGKCKECRFKYISVNTSKEGSRLYCEYEKECSETFKAIREKYLKKASEIVDKKK